MREKALPMASFRALWLLAMIWAALPVQAGTIYHVDEPWCDTMLVTFVDGATDTLKNARFEFPGGNRNYLDRHEAYLPMFQRAQYPRLLLIHLSKIAEATFEARENTLEVRATVDGGVALTGDYAQPETELVGTGKLGRVKVKLKDIRSLRFVEFKEGLLREGPALSRAAAARRWWTAMERERRTWTVLDGTDTLKAEGWLGFLDSFSIHLVSLTGRSSTSGSVTTIYVAPAGSGLASTIRSHTKARDATRDFDLDLLRLAGLDITGKAAEGCYEAIVTPSQGGKQTVCLSGEMDNGGWNNPTYGPFDQYDFLLWGMPFGFEGTPLLPNRKITVRETPQADPVERKPARTTK